MPNTFPRRTLTSDLVKTSLVVHEVIFMVSGPINQVMTPCSFAFNPKNVQLHERPPEVPRLYLTISTKSLNFPISNKLDKILDESPKGY